MNRRQWLWATGFVFARPPRAEAETIPVRYRHAPPHAAYYGLITPGSDAFGDAGRMSAPAPRGAAPAQPWFRDVTGGVLESEQLRRGIPDWVARLDPACGIDLYGNQGIAVADVDGDGLDEVYVCQPAGLPNRLFQWRSGRLVDISASSGLDLLDDCTSALFLDWRNRGVQDVVVLRGSGPLLFHNDGRGHFELVPDAFRFASPPLGTFTGMAAADYDRDGKLDLYFCCYSFFQSEAQYRYPSPYHDAQNGPPNFLFHNRLRADGTGHFEDVTKSAGLDQNNNRFSFAPAWCDYEGSGWPSLYVANDFGRNNLYRNREGRFTDVAAAARVEDMGPGMSACWFDEDGDGRPDLYVANMWSEVGQRVVQSEAFPHRSPALQEAYRRHTKGNSFYRNRGDGSFEDAGAQRGIEMGRWAWAADAADFDNDGQPEIYVTCGMLTGSKSPDLMSFFWRQVVAASPADGSRSAAYENGWNAINQFIREGYSWSGGEPNVLYRKEGSRYRDVSRESGLDIAADSRAFALTDIDGDGCLDVLLKSRLGPQLRVFQNRVGSAQNRIGIQLEGGPRSNRDAIGARVEVDGRVQWLAAGSGYLSQHTKTLYFGLAQRDAATTVNVRWPSGEEQSVGLLEGNALYRIREGEPPRRIRRFAGVPAWPAPAITGENTPALRDTWLMEPVPLPSPVRGPGLLILHGRERPRADAQFIDLTRDADLAAAYALFRRYLFEHRAELELPLGLLLDPQGRAVKVYGRIPDAARVAADLASPGNPLPFAGRRISRPGRDFFKLGAALLTGGYRRQALPYLEEVLRRSPDNDTTRVLVAQIHRESGRPLEARRELDRVLAHDSAAAAEAWNELGGLEQAAGNDRQALVCFERSLGLKADALYALLNAAQTAFRLGEASRASSYYERAIRQDASSAEAHNGLGLVRAQAGQPSEAEARFREAIRLEPGLGSAWNNLAVLLLRQSREAEAVETLREGIARAAGEELLYLNLGRILIQRKDRAAALEVMRQLQRAKPDSALAKKAIADLTAEPAK